MTKFRDSKNREWSVVINTGTIKKVRQALEVDLADPGQMTLDRLSDDPVLLVDALWLVCEAQAGAIGVNADDFGQSLVGDSIDQAVAAMVGAVADFFPARKRLLLQRANAKTQEAMDRAQTLALEKLESPELQQRLDKAMQERMEADVSAALTRLSSPTS